MEKCYERQEQLNFHFILEKFFAYFYNKKKKKPLFSLLAEIAGLRREGETRFQKQQQKAKEMEKARRRS